MFFLIDIFSQNIFEKNPKWVEFLRVETINLFKKHSLSRWTVFGIDNVLVFLTFFFAYLLRYNFVAGDVNQKLAIYHALITAAVYAVFALIFRSYSGLLRHTTLTDISIVFIVTTFSAITLIVFTLLGRIFSLSEYLTIPISIILIHYVTITVLLFFVRVFF